MGKNLRLVHVPAALAGMLWVVLSVGVAAGAPAKKARCPVSGKDLEVTDKTPRVSVQGKLQYFCCEDCPKVFAKQPEKFVKDVPNCPIMDTRVTPNAEERVIINNGLWYVCCPACVDAVAKDEGVLKTLTDVVSGRAFKANAESPHLEFKGQRYYFENAETLANFNKDPAKYVVLYGK